MAGKVGEHWISSWRKDAFELFLSECGYNVISDSAPEDYNETFLKSVGRQLSEDDLLSMERFVGLSYFSSYDVHIHTKRSTV